MAFSDHAALSRVQPDLHDAGPPYRADHVGSLLRPAALQQARARAESGAIGPGELQRIEDAAIAEAVSLQEEAGLRVITDGEFRRAYFHLDFLTAIEGVETYQDAKVTQFHTASGDCLHFSPPKFKVTGKLSRRGPIMRRDFEVIAENLDGGSVGKITIPSPSMALRGGRGAVDAAAYPDFEDFLTDLTAIFRQEIGELAAAGCRYLQLDDTNLAYLCDEAFRETARRDGQDPDRLAETYVRVINDALKAAPAEMYTAIHLCRGNFRSAYVAEGDYDPVADVLFNQVDVDAFLLEYDDERSGSFEPLRFVPAGKSVVLGLISSKTPQLESENEIRRRVDEASRVLPLDQLCLSPQCGFASTWHGNDLAMDAQRRKLELVVECAEAIWGTA